MNDQAQPEIGEAQKTKPDSRGMALTFLQTASQILAVAAGLIYFFGFLIVSVFDGTYGIADFSFFKTKVLAIGTLFTLLVALAMILTFRTFNFFGFKPERSNPSLVPPTQQNDSFRMADVAFTIPFGCIGLTPFLSFLFTKPFEWENGILWAVPSSMLLAALAILGSKRLKWHPIWVVLASLLNTAVLFVLVFRYSGRSFFWFVLWLSLVCAFTLYVSLKLQRKDEQRSTEWERLALFILPIIFGIYATRVFPNLKHQFGGGSPIPVVLHLTKKVAAFNSEIVSASLIDETEQGFYVISSDEKAVFVSRGLVEEVEFLRADVIGKKP